MLFKGAKYTVNFLGCGTTQIKLKVWDKSSAGTNKWHFIDFGEGTPVHVSEDQEYERKALQERWRKQKYWNIL